VTNRFTDRSWPLLRVRGDADCSHLQLVAPPAKMEQPAALAAWRNRSANSEGK
jgi:hypothetical protein